MKIVGIQEGAAAATAARRVILPKIVAVGLVVGAWQAVVLTRWRPQSLLPAPLSVLSALSHQLVRGDFYQAVAVTMSRAAAGYFLALLIGTAVGASVALVPVLRQAIGPAITGLQSMPSVAWFPFALLLFQFSEAAILFVVILGAAPSIANGIISGIDNVPVQLVAAGRIMGARGLHLYRRVVLPAAMPYVLGGLKQAWAFAWRSLLAGELLVVVAGRPSLGVQLQVARNSKNAAALLALLVVLLVIGIVVDFAFSRVDRGIRRRRGLLTRSRT